MMRKVEKGSIIFACICIIIGGVLTVVGVCGGGIGSVRTMMKNGGITIGFSSDDFDNWSSGTEHTLSLEDISNPDLELDLGAGEFEVKEGNTDELLVKSAMKVNVTLDGDTVKINTKNSVRLVNFGFSGSANKISIEVPKGTKFDDVSMKIGAGELRCENVSAQTLNLKVGAGEIIMNGSNAKEMKVDVGMGNFNFHGNVNGDIGVDCGMGNAQMWLDGNEKDYNYEIDCDMGNITVGKKSYGGVSAEQDIDNHAAHDIEVDCGMGNVEIFFNN